MTALLDCQPVTKKIDLRNPLLMTLLLDNCLRCHSFTERCAKIIKRIDTNGSKTIFATMTTTLKAYVVTHHFPLSFQLSDCINKMLI